MSLQVHPNEILLFFDSESWQGKKTLALARSMALTVHEIDIKKSSFTGTQWLEILGMLQLKPKELLNKSLPEYQKIIHGTNFNNEDWANVLCHYPQLLCAPIAIRGTRAILCKAPEDIYRLQTLFTPPEQK